MRPFTDHKRHVLHAFRPSSNSISLSVFRFPQITEQIQNLTVSSTTSNTSNSRTPNSEPHASKSTSLTSVLKETAAANSSKENLAQRLKFLQTQLAHAPMPSITSKRRQLPSIEEAWNLPISAEMSSRQQQSAQNQQQRAFAKNYNCPVSADGPATGNLRRSKRCAKFVHSISEQRLLIFERVAVPLNRRRTSPIVYVCPPDSRRDSSRLFRSLALRQSLS